MTEVSKLLNRCGNCLEPHRSHFRRMSAPPACPNGKSAYREGTDEELSAAYDAAFPNGPQPIATFDTSTPEGLAAARRALGRDALLEAFGPGGGGMPVFEANLRNASEAA